MGSSRRTFSTPPPPPMPQTSQNALVFRDGQAYGVRPMQAHGLSRATNPKRGVSPSPMNYKPLGYTAQEAGYFGPGRYGAAKQYGQSSVTNPNVPQLGNYYPAGGSNQMQFADQANQHRQSLEQVRAEARQAPTVFLDPIKSKGSPAKAPMSSAMYGGLF